jgi:serine/threonine protein phosphatase PrpC
MRVVMPPERLVPGLQVPSLSVTRSFGDLHLAAAGVIPTPDFAVFPLRPRTAAQQYGSAAQPQHVLIVASDGLWEVVSNEEAVEVAGAAGSPGVAAQQLLAAAQQRWAARHRIWHCDDITVAVAYL